MSNILRVIEPFFVTETGDTFTLGKSGMYEYTRSEEFRKNSTDSDVTSAYTTEFSISKDYAKELIDEGYLEEVVDTPKKANFVNVFDEIDNLIVEYTKQLKTVDTDLADQPQCVKVEKTTVLSNILKVLSHLKTLRK